MLSVFKMTQEEVQSAAALSIFDKFLFSRHKSNRLQMYFKLGALKNFAIFTGKHLCWSLFLLRIVFIIIIFFFIKILFFINFIKKRLQHHCFPVSIANFFRTAFL